jgi:hypothetical protein
MNATPATGAHEAPLQFVDPRQFKANTQVAVDDAHLRSSFRGAMDFLQTKRAAHFGDTDGLRAPARLWRVDPPVQPVAPARPAGTAGSKPDRTRRAGALGQHARTRPTPSSWPSRRRHGAKAT